MRRTPPRQWFNTGCFALPALFSFGNAERNSVLSPGTPTSISAIAKDVPLPNGARLQLRWEIFNVFNTRELRRAESHFRHAQLRAHLQRAAGAADAARRQAAVLTQHSVSRVAFRLRHSCGEPPSSKTRAARYHPRRTMTSQHTHHVVPVLIAAVLAGLPAVAAAQGTAADYARAAALKERYESAATDIAGPATAIGRTHRFWYRKSVKGGDAFMTIDADTLQKQPAFDHAAIARALSDLTGNRYTGEKLPFTTLSSRTKGRGLRYRWKERRIDARCPRRHADRRTPDRESGRVSASDAGRGTKGRAARRTVSGKR